MKAYTLFSPSHKIMYENYLKPTIPKDFDLEVVEVPQECNTANFYSEGWSQTCYHKVELFYRACSENYGNVFAFFDPDIHFFGNVKDVMLEELGDFDIACQDDINEFNSGNFICRSNSTTITMFERMMKGYQKEDQTTLNRHLHMCKHKWLSRRFFTYAHYRVGVWDGVQDFDIPDDILNHHANWVVGVDRKMQMMDIVRQKYNNKHGITQ